MHKDISFKITRTPFNEHYCVAPNTRITTNFANLARGPYKEENIRNTLDMISNRCNSLAHWDNSNKNRYSVTLEIISVFINSGLDCSLDSLGENDDGLPNIEMLQTKIVDADTGDVIDGIVGNNFSSYVRDYDFSVVLKRFNEGKETFQVPSNFGDFHGTLFKHFVESSAYKAEFCKTPVICLSVSDNKTYTRINNSHPILGAEYAPCGASLTEQYFAKMGLRVRYFMPNNSAAPLAFYFYGDLLNDYSNIELIATISTMETFQKIYRPEIYNANSSAGMCFKPSLLNKDYSYTHVKYDREERASLAVEQGKYIETMFIKPYKAMLEQTLTHQKITNANF